MSPTTASQMRSAFDTWLSQEAERSVHPKDGYYSFDALMDAYKQGKRIGAKESEEAIKDRLEKRFTTTGQWLSKNVVKLLRALLKEGVSVSEVLMKNTMGASEALFVVPGKEHHSDAFIAKFYALVADIEADGQKQSIEADFSFLDEEKEIDYTLIRSEGFAFRFDVKNGKLLWPEMD